MQQQKILHHIIPSPLHWASGVGEPINHLSVEKCWKYWGEELEKPRLPIDLIPFPTDDANEDHSHSKFVEDWKTQMSEAYRKALQNSSHRKKGDIAKHETIKKLSPVLQQGDRVLIRNMYEIGATGKMWSFWEENVHVAIENINNENVTYKLKSKRDIDRRIRVLQINMLLLSPSKLQLEHQNQTYSWKETELEDSI